MLIAGVMQTVALLLGITLLLVLLLRRSIRYYGRRRRGRIDPPIVRTARPEDDSRQPLSSAPPEMIRWQVEMHQVAREVKAELDTKMRMLLALIGEARNEREQLEQAAERAENAGISLQGRTRDKLAEAAADAQQTADRIDLDELPLMPESTQGE